METQPNQGNHKHTHSFFVQDNYLICSICGLKKLNLSNTEQEGLLIGKRSDGQEYSVRKHRKSYFYPDVWKKLYAELPKKAQLTAAILIQTGARINEARHIEERDIDYERNTLRLRVTKTKAKKAGEERGSPRTIPMNSKYLKELKKHFQKLPEGSQIGINTTSAFNITLKSTLKRLNIPDYYMYSAHSIRKTHGNWLKWLMNARMIECDISEICLRLGHSMEMYLASYGSSGAGNTNDLLLIKEIFGDLYERKF